MIGRTVLARALPFAVFILFLILDANLKQLFSWLKLGSSWLYVIRIALVCACFIYFWRDYLEIKIKPVLSDFLYASVSGFIVFVVWVFPYPSWLVAGVDATATNPAQGKTQLEALIWFSTRIMGAVLVVPVMEELFWRSYIMRRYDGKDFLSVNPETLSGFAYVGSACLFALEHSLWLPGLFAGLVYGELYKTYKNLWVPIFAHAVTNGLLGIWVIYTNNWQYW